MKVPWRRVILAAVVLGIGFWLWCILFPSPEKAIRAQLAQLARTASFEHESALAKAYNAQKLTQFFSTNVEISIDIHGTASQTLNGRDEIQQAALIARQRWQGMKVEFVDVHVTLSPDRQTAVANLTAKVTMTGETDFLPQELNFSLRKENGQWVIYHVETVKTLSLGAPASRRGIGSARLLANSIQLRRARLLTSPSLLVARGS